MNCPTTSVAVTPSGDAAIDQAIWERVGQGSAEALADLYDRHVGVMFRVAMRVLQNRRDAEDLIHDVFLEAWEKANQFDPQRGGVLGWLLLRVRSRAIDRIRTANVAKKYAQAIQPLLTELLVGHDDTAQKTDMTTARRALGELNVKQREVVELGYFQGLTCREISEQCDIPVGTVKSRLSAGMNSLRRQLVPVRERAS